MPTVSFIEQRTLDLPPSEFSPDRKQVTFTGTIVRKARRQLSHRFEPEAVKVLPTLDNDTLCEIMKNTFTMDKFNTGVFQVCKGLPSADICPQRDPCFHDVKPRWYGSIHPLSPALTAEEQEESDNWISKASMPDINLNLMAHAVGSHARDWTWDLIRPDGWLHGESLDACAAYAVTIAPLEMGAMNLVEPQTPKCGILYLPTWVGAYVQMKGATAVAESPRIMSMINLLTKASGFVTGWCVNANHWVVFEYLKVCAPHAASHAALYMSQS